MRGLFAALALSAGLLLASASAQAHAQPHARKDVYQPEHCAPATICHELAPRQFAVVTTCPAEAYVLPAAPYLSAIVRCCLTDTALGTVAPPNQKAVKRQRAGAKGNKFKGLPAVSR